MSRLFVGGKEEVMNYIKTVIKPGDEASRLGKEVGYRSHGNNPAVIVVAHEPGNFRGDVGSLFGNR